MLSIGNFGKEETMHMLRTMEKHLTIGSESLGSVMHDHEVEFPGQGRTALMRMHSTLHQKQPPTDDPDCPKEVKLAKRIECMAGNKAVVGNTKERFNLKEAQSGKS